MKLKSIIILSIIALGTLPLLIFVSINLKEHINRHEESTLQSLKTRAAITLSALQQKSSYLEQELQRIASLENIQNLVTTVDSPAQFANNQHSALQIINLWFLNSSSIDNFHFFDAKGRSLAFFNRQQNTSFAPFIISENSTFTQKPLQDKFSALIITAEENIKKKYILMTYPIILPNGSSGIMQVTVNLTSFAADFGNYIFTTSSQTAPPLLVANKHFPYNVPALTGSKPFFQSEKTEQVIWLPLTFNNQQPIAWIGERINSSAALKWKKSLILNIVALLAVTAMAITIIASIIARKVERLKVELVEGLNQIMNDNQQVNFTWSFPDELQNLALDLTNLSKNYNQSRAANRAAQKKLQESEDKFRKLTSSAQDGIIMMDNQGNIAYWNKGAERIFRFSARQAMGKSSHKLLNLRRPDQENSNDKQITTKHVDISRPSKPDVIELTARRNDNQDIPIELSLSSTEIKGQWHAIWIIRDISERKKAEAEAFLRQQQLIQSDKMRSLGLLVSGVAHEINNPNSISMLNTSLLHKAWHEITPILDNYYKQNGDFLVAGLNYSEMRQQIPRLFTELAESNKRIKSIVHDLKDYARKKEPDSSELADINEIINTAARLTRNQIKKCGADFNVNFSTPQIVKGNKQRLEQVIINLLQNACEAVIDAKDAEISITTNKVDVDKVIITVADNGIGIKVEDLNLITDPFYTTRRTLGGTGLGLSVSAGIIKEHRGNLSFKSAPGNGTLAIITLPLANS